MDALRTEQIAALALEKVQNDRYLLANLIFARVKELSNGAKPLIDTENFDLKKSKLPDIAMQEIAEGKIIYNSREDKE